jgi:hypothetical protein
LFLFPHVIHAVSLRKEDNLHLLLLEKIEKLEGMVLDLQSQVSEQQRRLAVTDCFPEVSLDGNQCVFARNVTFTELVGFEGPASFHDNAEFNDDVKFEDWVLFTASSTVDFLGKATFEGPQNDPDDNDSSEFAVEFRTQPVFKHEVLFEGDTVFEDSVLFLRDLTIEGPGARRSRRRLKKDDDDSSKQDKGPNVFEIVGEVDVDVDSDEDVVLRSKTWFEDDVHLGEYDDRRGRLLKNDKKKKKHNLIVSGGLDIESDLVVEGLVDMKEDAVVHGIIVFESDECLVACDGTLNDHGLC